LNVRPDWATDLDNGLALSVQGSLHFSKTNRRIEPVMLHGLGDPLDACHHSVAIASRFLPKLLVVDAQD
jgi:hypothetical protein